MTNWTGEKLRRYLVVNERSPETLAKQLGKAKTTIYNWIEREKLSQEQIELLSDAGIDLDAGQKSNVSHETSKGLPYYDVDVSAGQVEMFDQAETPAFFAAIPGFEDCNFGIRVFGSSMWPTYPSGVYVVCKSIKDYDVIPYGECFLIITDELRMIKRLMKSKYKGFVLATSDNEELKNGNRVYDTFELPKTKIRSLHLVKGQVRKEQI